jgi:hypothetical protein
MRWGCMNGAPGFLLVLSAKCALTPGGRYFVGWLRCAVALFR